MSDNSSEENESNKNFDIEGNDGKKNNSFVKRVKELENDNQIPSTINNEMSQNTTLNNSIIMNINYKLNENIFMYLYNDKIPEIRIKDENKLINEGKIENIETYIKCIFNPNFDDGNYNICENCRKNNNCFFCKKSYKNLCDTCSKYCKKKHKNKLTKLNPYKIEFYKKEIKKIIEKHFIELNNEPIKKYTNDILLINLIIQRKYKNNFHHKNIENFYKYMKKKYDINDQILLKYRIKNNETLIKIFGCQFVQNNKKKCFIIYEDKEFELKPFFILENKVANNILKISLIGINNITDMSYMFGFCSSLISLPDISKWKTNNVTNMYRVFSGCSSLISLPDISKWNTNNVIDMRKMFDDCSSLISLPDISNWNTSNVTNMSWMFYKCSSLISLPDISKWNTYEVTDILGMFSGCSSLISLPDISKWKIYNNKNYIASKDCLSLIYKPDIK